MAALEKITGYLEEVRDFYQGQLGVDGVKDVKALPPQEKLLESLVEVPVSEEPPEEIPETKEPASGGTETAADKADAVIKRFQERHRDSLSTQNAKKKSRPRRSFPE